MNKERTKFNDKFKAAMKRYKEDMAIAEFRLEYAMNEPEPEDGDIPDGVVPASLLRKPETPKSQVFEPEKTVTPPMQTKEISVAEQHRREAEQYGEEYDPAKYGDPLELGNDPNVTEPSQGYKKESWMKKHFGVG